MLSEFSLSCNQLSTIPVIFKGISFVEAITTNKSISLVFDYQIRMESSMKGFEHLEIQLEEIKSATNNFNEENVIGHGGFSKLYKGELSHSHSEGKSMVALKRLDHRHGQGDAEFYKEVRMLSSYRHENITGCLFNILSHI